MTARQKTEAEEDSAEAVARRAVHALLNALIAPGDRDDAGPGGWWIVGGMGYRFQAPITSRRMEDRALETMTPAAVGWLRARLPTLPDADVIDKTPDWVCEVEDPWDVYQSKLALHEAAGVLHAWTLDPVALTLALYTRVRAAWSPPKIYREATRVRVPPFEGIELELSSLWR